MTYVQPLESDELRVILCLEFDPRAQPDDLAAFKTAVIESPNTLHSVEATGDFDFITEIAAPDLGWFNSWWKSLGGFVAAVVTRCEKSFICKRFIRRRKDEHAFWVRSGDELKRIEHSMVDKILAEGDYARVYTQGSSWLLHATMHSLLEQLSSKQFVQLHRSIIVRRGFIQGVSRDHDHWTARLRDGSTHRVAKSHAVETLKMVHSPT